MTTTGFFSGRPVDLLSMTTDNPKVFLKKTGKYGKGVFAKKRIRRGERIASFDGPIYDGDYNYWNNDLFNHTIQFGPDIWRDSSGLARWMNHSCDPNCGIKNLFDVVAMRTIEPGEQITWDYEMTERSTIWRMNCKCGSSVCRKRIGNYKNMPLKTRRKYKGFISSWLTRGRK